MPAEKRQPARRTRPPRDVEGGRVFTAEQVAARWAIETETFNALCRAGRVPGAFKVARWWRLREDALLAIESGAGDPFASVAYDIEGRES